MVAVDAVEKGGVIRPPPNALRVFEQSMRRRAYHAARAQQHFFKTRQGAPPLYKTASSGICPGRVCVAQL